MGWLDRLVDSFRKEIGTRYELVRNIEEQVQNYENERRRIISEIKELESLPEKPIVVFDRKRRIIEANRHAEEVTSYPVRFFIGRTIELLLPDENIGEFQKKIFTGKDFEIRFNLPYWKERKKEHPITMAMNAEVVIRDDYNAAVLEKLFDFVSAEENGQQITTIFAEEAVDSEKCRLYLAEIVKGMVKGRNVVVDFSKVKKFRSAAAIHIYRYRTLLGDFSKVFRNFPEKRYNAVAADYAENIEKRLKTIEHILEKGNYIGALKNNSPEKIFGALLEDSSKLEVVKECFKEYILIEQGELESVANLQLRVGDAEDAIAKKHEEMLKEIFGEEYNLLSGIYRKALKELSANAEKEKPVAASLGGLTDISAVSGVERFNAFPRHKTILAYPPYKLEEKDIVKFHMVDGYELEKL